MAYRDESKHIGKTVHAIVKDKLREEIISGNIAPGTKLTINQIAKQYNVSQMPVRQAFQSLEAERLIEILPYKGARVLELDVNFVKDIFELRSGLECLMARLSMSNIDEETIKTLKSINNDMKQAEIDDNIDLFIELNVKFHKIINEKSNNKEAVDIYTRYSNLIKTLRGKYGVNKERFSNSVEEHDRIIQFIKKKDDIGLYKEFVKHGDNAKNVLISSMKKNKLDKFDQI